MTKSLQQSPTMEREEDAVPVQQPQSKRDKRRNALMERMNDITQSFTQNKDQYYREQLGAIQQDIAMILHADPYLENPAKEATQELMTVMHKLSRGDPRVMQAIKEGDMASIGGKIYHEFMNEVQDAMERRDAALTSFAVSSWSSHTSYQDAHTDHFLRPNTRKSLHNSTQPLFSSQRWPRRSTHLFLQQSEIAS